MPASLRLTVLLLMAALWAAASASAVEPRGAAAALEEALAGIPAGAVPSGVLYDRVLPLSRIERFDGTSNAPETDLGDWRQAEDELRRATLGAPFLPRLADLPSGRIEDGEDLIPLAILDVRYDRLRSDALETGAIVTAGGTLRLGRGEAFVAGRAELAAPLRPFTHRGTTVRFRLDPSLFLSNDPAPLARLSIDFDDGRGPLDVDPSGDARVHYATTGRKSLRVRAILADGRSFEARTSFLVRDLRTPSPNDTIHVTATIPYLGQYGTGDAYVYLAEGHDTITNPVVVIEGFDIDNTMHWDELYALLNRQNLLETLRGEGFDAVVLDFTDAVDYIQRNAFVAEALLEQVASSLLPQETMVVVGASMGGLVGRYALAWMETHGIPHRTRTFLSFDSPQAGADVPLGIQYWLDFFANDSAEAAALLAALDTPGARQMLVYHHTSPPGGTGESDPLRTELLADLQAAGGYPVQLRKAAVANGSGSREDQGFAPAQQILLWEYSSWLVDVTGDVWAVPDGSAATIFRGEIDVILLPPDETTVTVSGTRPFDGAPGGWRDSMAQMDAVEAPYGDIIALHPNHCFIPTVSALDLDTADLFHDVAGDPDLLSLTPFDAVYFPSGGGNQEHVDIGAENAAWILDEVRRGASRAPDTLESAGIASLRLSPNPASNGKLSISFSVPEPGPAHIAVHDVTGRCVRDLGVHDAAAGFGRIEWDQRGDGDRPLPAGLYFVRLRGVHLEAVRSLVLLQP